MTSLMSRTNFPATEWRRYSDWRKLHPGFPSRSHCILTDQGSTCRRRKVLVMTDTDNSFLAAAATDTRVRRVEPVSSPLASSDGTIGSSAMPRIGSFTVRVPAGISSGRSCPCLASPCPLASTAGFLLQIALPLAEMISQALTDATAVNSHPMEHKPEPHGQGFRTEAKTNGLTFPLRPEPIFRPRRKCVYSSASAFRGPHPARSDMLQGGNLRAISRNAERRPSSRVGW